MINISSKHAVGRETVIISGSLTVEHAVEFKTELQNAFKKKAKNIVLSLGPVTKADLTFFQVICSAHRTATVANKSFCVEQFQQEPLIRAHRSMGFTRRVGCVLDKTKSCVFMLMSKSV
jgi:anti-anti-sigma regulatory factor